MRRMGDVPPLSTKVKIGDTVTFGNYEQDNNLDNGQESIEWEVLDNTGWQGFSAK